MPSQEKREEFLQQECRSLPKLLHLHLSRDREKKNGFKVPLSVNFTYLDEVFFD